MTLRSLPTRTLPEHPHLDQLKRQGRELREGLSPVMSPRPTKSRRMFTAPARESFALHDALLWGGAACGGDPEIVALALGRIDWPPSGRTVVLILEQPLRL